MVIFLRDFWMCHFSLPEHLQWFSSTLLWKFKSLTWTFKAPLGSSPIYPLLPTTPGTAGLISNKKSEFEPKVSTSTSLFLLFVRHHGKMNCPSFQAQPECCLIHEPQAQMTALSSDSKDDAHFNGNSYHTPSAITAFCANTASAWIVWAFWGFLQTPCGIKVLHRQGAE